MTNFNITPQQAKELMATGNFVVLDVRRPDEFETGHIQGAVNFPLQSLATVENAYPDKATAFLVYCHSGKRSDMACRFLSEKGYTCHNFGGIIHWPFEVVE